MSSENPVSDYKIEAYADRASASSAASQLVADCLQARLAKQKSVAMLVGGGSSPVLCFETLSQIELPWERVTVSLTDERCVAPDHEDSNERMLRATLLTNCAAAASFVSPLDSKVADLPRPFAVSMVGMGEDGHFASIFPDNPQLASALDLNADELTFPVSTSASPHPRVSFSLAALVQSDLIILLAFGQKKREIIEDPDGFPVAALLQQSKTPLRILWAN